MTCFGAENDTRTRDPNLGKVMLYQLSYFRVYPFFSFGIAKVRRIFKLPNFFDKNFKFSSKICFFAPFCGSESLFRHLYPVNFHPSAVILRSKAVAEESEFRSDPFARLSREGMS